MRNSRSMMMSASSNTPVDVADFEPGVAGHVILERWVKLRRSLRHRVFGGGHGGQHLVIDIDEVECLLRLMDAVGGDRSDGVPSEQNLAPGKYLSA